MTIAEKHREPLVLARAGVLYANKLTFCVFQMNQPGPCIGARQTLGNRSAGEVG
jgi:hypothetical protein